MGGEIGVNVMIRGVYKEKHYENENEEFQG